MISTHNTVPIDSRIWRLQDDGILAQEWSIEPKEWEPRHVQWVDDVHLRLERVWPFTPEYKLDTTIVSFEGGAWRLHD